MKCEYNMCDKDAERICVVKTMTGLHCLWEYTFDTVPPVATLSMLLCESHSEKVNCMSGYIMDCPLTATMQEFMKAL